MKKSAALMVLVAATVMLMICPAPASDWPQKSISIVVPYKAGGSADRLARGIAPFLEKELGQPVVIENRPGAGSQVGTLLFLSRPADGNSVLLAVQPYMSATMVLQGAKYSIDDFEVVNAENVGAISVSVPNDSPYKTFDDLHQAIKKNPAQIKVGTVQGGSPHLLTLLLMEKLGWDVRVVNYSSGAPIRTALLGGHIDFSTNGAVADATMKPNARSLALSTDTKLAVWPDAPYINDVLQSYQMNVPQVGDVRLFAFKKGFKEKYPQRWETFLRAYRNVLNSSEYRQYTEKIGTAAETAFRGPEKSQTLVRDVHQLLVKYKDRFNKKK